ncbi:hypothetical protein HCY90_00055 [Limosilactobacillus fermentum]
MADIIGEISKEDFVKSYALSIQKKEAAIFVGAGTSIPSGNLSWTKLIKPLADTLGININSYNDLVDITQYFLNDQAGNRSFINDRILDSMSDQQNNNQTLRAISELSVSTFWTTNYDHLLENYLEKSGKKVDIKRNEASLTNNIRGRDATVFKMHGDKDDVNNTVITRDDFMNYTENHPNMSTALRGDFINKTFLFIGYSFNDPNLNYILGKIKRTNATNQRRHFCIVKRIQKADSMYQDNDQQFQQDEVLQKYKVADLNGYGIKTVFVDSYDEISNILQDIKLKSLCNKVFISGSIGDYKDFDKASADKLIFKLAYSLVKKNFKVISGFGLGVGDNVINGALQAIDDSDHRSLDDNLSLFPFPMVNTNEEKEERAARWTKYRKKIISESGICIFLFGNKKTTDGKTVLADGMEEEFEIAESMNKFIIPVGFTKYKAEELWKQLNKDLPEYLNSSDFQQLENIENTSEQTINKSVQNVVNLVEQLNTQNN